MNIFKQYIYMYKQFIRKNVILVSIILFIIIFGGIQMLKPSCLYNPDGSLREFGIGYKNKTILPVWMLSLILGILSYVLVLFYITKIRM
jgi:hypothetical protein